MLLAFRALPQYNSSSKQESGRGVMAMVNAENIKTIVVDLDRTLLHTDKTLSAHTVQVLKKCKENGMRIMVATARPLRTISQYCELVDFDGIVVSNGARVICKDRRTDHGICRKRAERLLIALSQHTALRITLETGECAYSNKPVADYETVLSDNLAGVAKAEGALKILVTFSGEEALETVKANLSDDLYYTVSCGHLLQIMSKQATKWNGVKSVLCCYNISPWEAVYFGDDNDDIEPIKMCGLGIAVSNGIDEVKAVADGIAESNDADGVAKFIEHNIITKNK